MGGQFDRARSPGERKLVGDKFTYVQPPRKHQLCHFALESEVGRVAANEVFLVHADGGEVEAGVIAAACVGKKQQLAGAAQEALGLENGGIGGDGDDGGIEAAELQGFDRTIRGPNSPPLFGGAGTGVAVHDGSRDGPAEIRIIGADGPAGTPLACELEPLIEQIAGDNFDAAQGEDAREEQADRALAGDERDVAAQKIQAFDGFEDGVDRLLHGAFDESIARGDFDHAGEDEGHHADEFRVAAACGFEAGGNAGAFVLIALGKRVVAAGVAFQAGDMVMQRDAVADAKSADARADFNDGAGGFMAENTRRRDGAVVDFFYVGRTDTAGGDLNQDFAAGDARHGDCFEAKVLQAAIDDGAHGVGNVREHGEECRSVEGIFKLSNFQIEQGT